MLVVGRNGAGKTNLLEALHLGTQGFSPRTRNDAEVIRFGEGAGRIAVRGRRGATPVDAEVELEAGRGKRARLNGAPLRAAELLRAELAALVFTPDRLGVVKGAPAVRRAYVDRALGRLFPARSSLSAEYGAAVGQRNAALRRVAAGLSTRAALEPWSERVVELGSELRSARRQVLDLLVPEFARLTSSFGLEPGGLVYEGEPLELARLDALLERDLQRGATGLGPHLDDVGILAGERDLRSFGSQGEQRLAVLSLLLAEAAALTERREAPPLLLLDDVLSELDPERRATLVQLLPAGGQALVTSTTRAALPAEPAQLLEVSPGEVRAA